jgi:hypothetical protein
MSRSAEKRAPGLYVLRRGQRAAALARLRWCSGSCRNAGRIHPDFPFGFAGIPTTRPYQHLSAQESPVFGATKRAPGHHLCPKVVGLSVFKFVGVLILSAIPLLSVLACFDVNCQNVICSELVRGTISVNLDGRTGMTSAPPHDACFDVV